MSRRLQLVLVPLRSTEELAMMMESFRSCIHELLGTTENPQESGGIQVAKEICI